MNTSDSISKIAPALLKAQRAITFAVKDAKNPHFKSTYADLSSVIEACKPALNDAGIVFIQMAEPCEAGSIALTTRLIHESGEWIESTATCAAAKADAQAFGSATTYLRRYTLASAVGLYQDDDDANAAVAATKARPAAQTQAHPPAQDMSPKARAQRIEEGVKTGDAPGAAAYLATLPQKELDTIWTLLKPATIDQITAAWPETAEA